MLRPYEVAKEEKRKAEGNPEWNAFRLSFIFSQLPIDTHVNKS
jgi:hypothetical protein